MYISKHIRKFKTWFLPKVYFLRGATIKKLSCEYQKMIFQKNQLSNSADWIAHPSVQKKHRIIENSTDKGFVCCIARIQDVEFGQRSLL